MNAAGTTLCRITALALVLAAMGGARAEDADRTLSPYFAVQGGDGSTDPLPLKSTRVDVDIAGIIADVRVTQEYRNEGGAALEAVYVFPGSTRAAVHGLRMTVGGRTIVARIEETKRAREQYESAKRAGQTASLLEQERPNVFRMNVANVLPGDRVGVELRYTELLVPDGGVYEFVYPTVVGPRYSNRRASAVPAPERWVETPHLHQGVLPASTLDVDVRLAAGTPIRDVGSPSHRVDVQGDARREVHVALAPDERHGGNRDFVLRYRLAGERFEPGLLLSRGDENFFLLTVQPPARVAAADVVPREYVFVMDVSGSMVGFPLEVSKALLTDLVGGLRTTDRFDVVLFAGGSSVLADDTLPASKDNLKLALAMIAEQQGGGGTELLPALRRALALPRHAGYARTVVLATDGYVDVEPEAFELVRSSLGDANLFAFGIGSSVNRHLIEGLARAGQGEPFVVEDAAAAPERAARFRRYVQSPVATHLTLEADGFDVFDREPAALPDVFAERPIVVVGKWRGAASGRLVLRGLGAAPFERVIDVGTASALDGDALRQLWARQRIARLADDGAPGDANPHAAEVTRLGLSYDLLTEYTSFVAIDSRIRHDGAPGARVDQPLPLPQGVEDSAVANLQSLGYAGGAKGVNHVAAQATSAPLVRAMRKSAAPAALAPPPPPPPPPSPLQSVMADESARTPSGGCLDGVLRAIAFRAGAARQLVVRLDVTASAATVGRIESGDTADATALRNALGVGAASLRSCPGRYLVRLAIDARGTVTGVTVVPAG